METRFQRPADAQEGLSDEEVRRSIDTLRVPELREEIKRRGGNTKDQNNRALRKDGLIELLRSLVRETPTTTQGDRQSSKYTHLF